MIDTKIIRNRILFLALKGELAEQNSKDAPAIDLIDEVCRKMAGRAFKPDFSADEVPYDLPSSWSWCRLSDIGSTNIGLTYHPEDVIENGVIVARSSNIVNGKMDYSDLVRVSCNVRENQYLNNSDILICARNGSKALVGKCAIYEGISKTIAFGAFMAVFRTPLFRYVYYYFNTDVFKRNFISDDSKQINQVTQNILKKSLIPIPPLEEQKRIVKRIETIFEILDKIDTLQNQYAFNQEALKSKLIDAAIQGKLTEQLPEDGTAEELYQTISEKKKEMQKRKEIKNSKPLPEISEDEMPFEIPSNWKWVHLDDITTKITSGSTPAGGRKSNAYVESGNCFFREQNIYNDGIHQEGMVYITDELLSTRKNSTVIAKDILLNITGGSIGRCALIPDDFQKGSINQHILIIRMVDDRLRFYVHKLLCSPYAQRYIKEKSVGDKDGFSGGRCKQMSIPLPPLTEQSRIVETIDNVLEIFNMAI